MKSKKGAIVYISILSFIFIITPVLFYINSLKFKGSYNGLKWASNINQTSQWVFKNNNQVEWNKCKLNHVGFLCYRMSLKDNKNSKLLYSDFQFKEDKLFRVVETYKNTEFYPIDNLKLSSPIKGRDLEIYLKKERGVRYEYINRAFYYAPVKIDHNTYVTYIICNLIETVPLDFTIPEKVVEYQLTKVYSNTKDLEGDFIPSFRFQNNK